MELENFIEKQLMNEIMWNGDGENNRKIYKIQLRD